MSRERWKDFDGNQQVALVVLGVLFLGALVGGVSDAADLGDVVRVAVIALALPVVLASHRLSDLFDGVSSQQEGAVMLLTGLLLAGALALVGPVSGGQFDEGLYLCLGAYCLLGLAQLVRPYLPSSDDLGR